MSVALPKKAHLAGGQEPLSSSINHKSLHPHEKLKQGELPLPTKQVSTCPSIQEGTIKSEGTNHPTQRTVTLVFEVACVFNQFQHCTLREEASGDAVVVSEARWMLDGSIRLHLNGHLL